MAEKEIVTITGLPELQAGLAQLGLRMRPADPAVMRLLARISAAYIQRIHDATDLGTDLESKPFRPLAKRTAEAVRDKRKGTVRGYDHILRDYGTMLASVSVLRKLPGESHIGPLGKLEQAKGAGHQYGKPGLPRRSWLGWRKGWEDVWESETEDWFDSLMKGI